MKNPGRIYWLIPVAVLFLAATVLLLPVFNLKTIEISTDMDEFAGEMAFSAGLEKGSNMFIVLLQEGNIFSMRFTGAEKRLSEEYEFLENIVIKAKLPSSAVITYETRKPVFEVAYGDRYLVTDIKGCVLGSRDEHVLGFTRITGIEIDQFTLGCIICDDDIFIKLGDIYSELESYDKRFLTAYREYIEWIDVSTAGIIALYFDDRILVKMDPDGDMGGQTAAMCEILTEHIGGNETGTLDFTVGENPVFSPE